MTTRNASPAPAKLFRDSHLPETVKKTWNVQAALQIEFNIKYSTNILSLENRDLLEYGDTRRRLIAIDQTVYDIYGGRLIDMLKANAIEFELCILDATETNKNLATLERLLGAFEDFKVLRRAEPVIAMGGGVLLDIVGLAASIYRRGIPYIRVPTTLLALIDA